MANVVLLHWLAINMLLCMKGTMYYSDTIHTHTHPQLPIHSCWLCPPPRDSHLPKSRWHPPPLPLLQPPPPDLPTHRHLPCLLWNPLQVYLQTGAGLPWVLAQFRLCQLAEMGRTSPGLQEQLGCWKYLKSDRFGVSESHLSPGHHQQRRLFSTLASCVSLFPVPRHHVWGSLLVSRPSSSKIES